MKTCSKCGVEQDEGSFPPQKGNKKQTLHSWCRPCHAVSTSKYRKDNPEKVSESYRAWAKKDGNGAKHWQKWYTENPAKALKHRAKRRGFPCNLTNEFMFRLYELQPVCCLCKKEFLESPKDRTRSVDRIDQAGGYTEDNVWLLCHRCNRKKGDLTLDELKYFHDAISAALTERKKS